MSMRPLFGQFLTSTKMVVATMLVSLLSYCSAPEKKEAMIYGCPANTSMVQDIDLEAILAVSDSNVTEDFGLDDYVTFVDYNDSKIQELADKLTEDCNSKEEEAQALLDYVNGTIEYDWDEVLSLREYVRKPGKTLSDGKGDCEDVSILYASLLKSRGIETGLIVIPGIIPWPKSWLQVENPKVNQGGFGHIAVAVEGDFPGQPYQEVGGKNYYFAETTGNKKNRWIVGVVPSQMKGMYSKLYLVD